MMFRLWRGIILWGEVEIDWGGYHEETSGDWQDIMEKIHFLIQN
jgi:hypothetical protein